MIENTKIKKRIIIKMSESIGREETIEFNIFFKVFETYGSQIY